MLYITHPTSQKSSSKVNVPRNILGSILHWHAKSYTQYFIIRNFGTYLVFWEQLVSCTVLRRRKNHFQNQNSCFVFQNQEALVCKPLYPHVSNAFSQQPLSYWQKCFSLNLSETRTLMRCSVQLCVVIMGLIDGLTLGCLWCKHFSLPWWSKQIRCPV